MAGVKKSLTESEKKKIQKLSGLGELKTKMLSPIEKGVVFTRSSEEEKKPTVKEEIEKSANEYFKSLIDEEQLDSSDGEEEIQVSMTPKEQEKEVGSRVLKAEPYDMDSETNYENMPSEMETEETGGEEKPKEEIKPKDIDELFELLDEINEEHSEKTDKDYYEDLIPEVKDSLNLEKLEVPELDEDEIKKQVETKLNFLLEEDKNKQIENAKRKENQLLAQKEELINNATSSEAEINEIYDNAKIESSNESLKRGLARSTIAVLSINGLERDKAESLSNLARELSVSLENLEQNIENLKSELEISLENLDIEYAIEIDEQIKEEAEKLYKKQKEAIEFNNGVEKLEADYQSKREGLLKEAREREEELAKEYKGIAKKTKEKEIKESVLNYFAEIPKDQAIKELAGDQRFADYLGESFFDVYYEIMRRK